jgi:hypothetical protein
MKNQIQRIVDMIIAETDHRIKSALRKYKREQERVGNQKYVTQATRVDDGDTCHVPSGRIMPVFPGFTIDGTVKLDGTMILVDPGRGYRKLGTYEERYDGVYGSYPPSWQEIAVCPSTDISGGAWNLGTYSAATNWEYRHHAPVDISTLPGRRIVKFVFGPVTWWDYNYLTPLDYTIAIHGETGDVLNPNVVMLLRIQWTGSAWQMRGEYSNGGSPVLGDWYPLPRPLPQPIWIHHAMTQTDGVMNDLRIAVGMSSDVFDGGSPVLESVTSLPFARPWRRITMTRTDTSYHAMLRIGGITIFGAD